MHPDIPANFHTAFARKHHVQNEKIYRCAGKHFLHFLAVSCNRNMHSPLLQKFMQEIANGLVVIDNQNMRFRFHTHFLMAIVLRLAIRRNSTRCFYARSIVEAT